MMMADAPPPPPAVPKRAMVEAPTPPLPMAGRPRPGTRRRAPIALPMFATLAAVPPSLPSRHRLCRSSARCAGRAPQRSRRQAAEPAEIEPSEPIAGPVPVPRRSRTARVAL